MASSHIQAMVASQLLMAVTSVLVHLGCYSKIPQTRWLINDKHLFLTILELSSGCRQGQVRALFGAPDFSVCPYTMKVARKLSGASL